MKNSLLSQALESLETPVPSALPASAAPATAPTIPAAASTTPVLVRENNEAAVAQKIEKLSRDQVVMNAPLSTLFTRALNIALSKKDVATGVHEGVTPAAATQEVAVAQESQAQDIYFSQQARRLVEDALAARPGDPTEPKKPEVLEQLETGGSGTRLQTRATNEEVVRFFNDQSLDDIQPDFIFYKKVGERTDGVVEPNWDQTKMIYLNEDGGEGTYVVESIEVVVRTRKVEISDQK